MSKEDLFSCYPSLQNVSYSKDGKKEIQSFVLRTNTLSGTLTEGVLKYFPLYAVSFDREKIRTGEKLDLKALYHNSNERFVVEIGFGNGSSFIKMAEKNPATNYFGFEVYLNGFAECLTEIGGKNLTNARVMRGDAIGELENCFPIECIDGFNIFFPDPWPKKRHHKRRLMSEGFVNLLTSKLKKGGYIHFATDIEDYAEETLTILENTPTLKNSYSGFAPNNIDREPSTFERKGLEAGRVIRDLYFVKIS